MTVTCKFCLTDFEAKRNTATFCCDSHRTLFGKLPEAEKESRTQKLTKLSTTFLGVKQKLGSLSNMVTTANNVLPPKNLHIEENLAIAEKSWVQDVANYCEQEGIIPADLIAAHKSLFMPKKTKKAGEHLQEPETPNLTGKNAKHHNSTWFENYRKLKLGIK